MQMPARKFTSATIIGLAGLGVAACSSSVDVTPPDTTELNPPPQTYSIELPVNPIKLMAPPWEPRSVDVTAIVRTGAGDLVSHAQVQWTIDSPEIATVTQAGTITAVGEGTAVLRARFNGATATTSIIVDVPVIFTMTGSSSVERLEHTATLLDDGRVLIAGGQDRSKGPIQGSAVAELYDPETGSFTRTGDMKHGRYGHSATLLGNGKVLIAGGAATGRLVAAELYDPATGTFSSTGDLHEPQTRHEATLLTSGKVLISGGFGSGFAAATPELYDPVTGTFATTGTYAGADYENDATGLIDATATLLRDGRVLLTAQPAAQVYDPLTGAFSRTATTVTGAQNGFVPRYLSGRTATLLSDGRVLVAGGHHEDLGRFNGAELFDPATSKFVRTGDMSFVRDGHTATLLPNGTVLIAGGESVSGCSVLSRANVDIYDASSGTFSHPGRMNVRREFHSATRLRDGRVLVVGGLTFDGGLCGGVSVVWLSSAELYQVQ